MYYTNACTMSNSAVIRNKVKQFVEERGDTLYKAAQKTGISQTTMYALAKNPQQIPDSNTLNALCTHYKAQPGAFLEWVDG